MNTSGLKSAAMLFLVLVSASGVRAQKIIISSKYDLSDTCRVLYADSAGLTIWRGNMPYDSRDALKCRAWLAPSEIYRVFVIGKSRFGYGIGMGFLTGATAGAVVGLASGDDDPHTFLSLTAGAKAIILGFTLGITGAVVGGVVGASQGRDYDFTVNGNPDNYLVALPVLTKIAMYRPPAELEKMPVDSDAYAGRRAGPPLKPPMPFPEPLPGRFHFTFGGDMHLFGPASSNMTDAFNNSGFGGTVVSLFGRTTFPTDGGNPVYWNLSADYSLLRNIRLGLYWSSGPTNEVGGKDLETERTSAKSYAVIFTYIPSPVDAFLAARSEISATAGLSYNILEAGGSISSMSFWMTDQPTIFFNQKKTAIGFMLHLNYDYYLTAYLSLRIGIGGQYIPAAIRIPGVRYTSVVDGSVKELLPHSINFSGADLSTAIRIHP